MCFLLVDLGNSPPAGSEGLQLPDPAAAGQDDESREVGHGASKAGLVADEST